MPNLIPGEAEIVVSGVTLTKTGTRAAAGNEIYSLSGTASNANRNITLSGTVGNGLSLDVTFKVTSAIANTWKPAAVPFTFAITAGAEAMINMHGLFGQEVIPLSYLPSMIEPLGSSVFAGMVDFKLQMKDNGNLIAKWAPIGEYPMFEAGESQEGMVTYNVVDNQVYVQIALVDLITNLVASGGLSTDLLGSLGMSITDLINLATSFSQALPINIEVTGSSLKATVTKAMMLPYLDNLIPLLQGLVGTIEIPEAIATEMGITGPALAGFLGEVKTAIEESSQFDLVINLVPAS